MWNYHSHLRRAPEPPVDRESRSADGGDSERHDDSRPEGLKTDAIMCSYKKPVCRAYRQLQHTLGVTGSSNRR